MDSDTLGEYPAVLGEEERKLRWLIARSPAHVELRYYLVLLLALSRKRRLAIEECRQILSRDPSNFLARVWQRLLTRERTLGCSLRNRSGWKGAWCRGTYSLRRRNPRIRADYE